MKHYLVAIVGMMTAFGFGSSASAAGVRVECWGPCNNISPQQACDANEPGHNVSGISCDNISQVGIDTGVPCGNGGTCFVLELGSNNSLAWWCDDGPGFDALVNCR